MTRATLQGSAYLLRTLLYMKYCTFTTGVLRQILKDSNIQLHVLFTENNDIPAPIGPNQA